MSNHFNLIKSKFNPESINADSDELKPYVQFILRRVMPELDSDSTEHKDFVCSEVYTWELEAEELNPNVLAMTFNKMAHDECVIPSVYEYESDDVDDGGYGMSHMSFAIITKVEYGFESLKV